MGTLATRRRLGTLGGGCSRDLTAVRRGSSSLDTGRCVVVKLYVLTTVLTTTLMFNTVMLLHFVVLAHGRGGTVDVTGRRGRLGAGFVRGVSTRVRPALSALSTSLPNMGTLRTFSGRVRRLSRLRAALSRPCRIRRGGVSAFYRNVVSGVGKVARRSIALAIGAPGLGIGVGPRRLRHILLRLLRGTTRCAPTKKGV